MQPPVPPAPGMPRDGADTLGLPEAEMRRLAHRVADLVVDRLVRRGDEPAIRADSPAALRERLGGPLPEHPGDADAAIDTLVAGALAFQQHGDHPRYFARVPGPSSFAAILGEWLGTGFNCIATSWAGGSGTATAELVALDWLRAFLGLAPGGEGILSSGGSIANLTALAAARDTVDPGGEGSVLLSDQVHASIPRALRLLGYPAARIRILPTDGALRLPADAVAATVAADPSVRIVVASAGTTNTGAVDPLADLAAICAPRGLWLHVDGAYGAVAASLPEEAERFRGLSSADSLVTDPHKWLFQPYDVGCTFVRRPGALLRTFAMAPEYLKDTAAAAGETGFGNLGPELTRRARGLKLWLTFRMHGAEAIRAAIRRGIDLAREAEEILRGDARRFEIVTPATLAIVTFALRGGDAAGHEAAVKRLSAEGFATFSTTSLRGRSVLRLCTLNPLTTPDDLRGTIERIAAG